VFTTAYSEHAIDAIKFSALDYLLKPINIDDLKGAIAKAQKKLSGDDLKDKVDFLLQNFKVDSSDNFKLVLPTSEGLIFINFKDILYCEASSNYTIFHMRDNKKYVVSKTLKEYEDLLVNYNFFRIHNSFLINLREIVKYVKGDGGYVVLSNEKALDVSKRKKEFFLTKLSTSKII
jgi:two-component system LytT family response regulator